MIVQNDRTEYVDPAEDNEGMSTCPLLLGCADNWTWDKENRSPEVRLHGPGLRYVQFHPHWSSGTAGVRGTRALNNGRYYWELQISQRIFGTSMMFGVGTKQARLHAASFVNLVGENQHSWGLSHKGLLWHGGYRKVYTKPFRENEATIIGILFDGINGTLTYYKDGKNLGIAFSGLQDVKEALYPMVCSTAAKTEMTLMFMRRDFVNLQDRCRAVILKTINNNQQTLEQLQLPSMIKNYLSEPLGRKNRTAGANNKNKKAASHSSYYCDF
nr:PREDICTED: SPRY domain-containing SOCS box protein 3 [Bemisia tabaci]